jgi:hypothetical protein
MELHMLYSSHCFVCYLSTYSFRKSIDASDPIGLEPTGNNNPSDQTVELEPTGNERSFCGLCTFLDF